ncbi:MAG: TolB family protein [Cyclobacteriaceae bacterium]|nr:TolB family protein [Cyclobacteriaceae bacterium]
MLILICTLTFMNISFAQEKNLGIFQHSGDFGNPENSGSTAYNESTQTYTIKGSGYNIWFERDEFHYVYDELRGDFILTANFEFIGKGVDPHRKIGWMVRESTAEDAVHMSAVYHGDGLTVLQWRAGKGQAMRDPEDQIFSAKTNVQVIQLERKAGEFTMRVAYPGESLQEVGSQALKNMPDEVIAGIFICSHNPEVIEEAKAWNVRIEKPVLEGYNPYEEGFLGSRLEIMNVFDGKRKVIHQSDTGFEAPNWMPDGNHLLFNSMGKLYKISVEGGEPVLLNTGFADRNNNDHGISFDGKKLAISHHREGFPGGGSTIYVLPVTGGEPKQVTERTPSYWHGWAPNNKEVVYVAQRDTSIYNIYRKNITGGNEEQLTFNKKAHADGPEYTPDGKYIYYNSSVTGTMQIWRMKPDGSSQEQVTFDENQDWFPHISPDGKWIVFISFPPEVPANDHPAYKRVELKLMPVSGGVPRVIAYLYGGQGTINVPSWSPDSQHIAFMSNPGRKE